MANPPPAKPMAMEQSQPQGIMDGQLDWQPQNGGRLFDCFNCAPFCGGKCCICAFCLPTCFIAKMWAYGSGQDFGMCNHLIPAYYCQYYSLPFVRYGIRTRLGVAAGGPCNGFCGDIICGLCCDACALCQELRGATLRDGDEVWDCLAACQNKKCGVMVEGGCKTFRPLCGGQ